MKYGTKWIIEWKSIFKVNNRIVPISIDFEEPMDQAIDDVQSGVECMTPKPKRSSDVTKKWKIVPCIYENTDEYKI